MQVAAGCGCPASPFTPAARTRRPPPCFALEGAGVVRAGMHPALRAAAAPHGSAAQPWGAARRLSCGLRPKAAAAQLAPPPLLEGALPHRRASLVYGGGPAKLAQGGAQLVWGADDEQHAAAAQQQRQLLQQQRQPLQQQRQPLQQQQQMQPQLCAPRRSDVQAANHALTRSIMRCSTWRELDELVHARLAELNAIHVTAALVRLVGLRSQPSVAALPRADEQHVPGLAAVAAQLTAPQLRLELEHLHAGCGQAAPHTPMRACAGSGAVQLHGGLQPRLLLALLERAMPRLQTARPRQVASMLWALARLDTPWQLHAGSTTAARALLRRAARLFGASQPRDLATVAWAAATLQLPVSTQWLIALQDAWLAGGSKQARPVHGLGRGASLGPPDAQSTTMLLWALIRLGAVPSSHWLEQLLQRAAPQLPCWPPRSVATLLWACGKLRRAAAGPPLAGAEHAALLAALQAHSQHLTLRDAAQALWGAASLQLQLPTPLLQQLLTAASRHAASDASPHPRMAAAAGAERSTLTTSPGASATVHSVSLALQALVRLCSAPQQQLPPHLLRPWLSLMLAGCSAADTHSLVGTAWALCRLRIASSCPLLIRTMLQHAATASHDVHVLRKSGGATLSRSTAVLLWAAAHCCSIECAPRARALGAPASANMCCATGRSKKRADMGQWRPAAGDGRQSQPAEAMACGAMQPAALLQMQLQGYARNRALPLAQAAMQQCALQLLASADQQRVPGDLQGLALIQQAGVQGYRVQPVLPGASLRDLAQLSWAVARLQLRLPAGWWPRCVAQAQQLACEAQPSSANAHALALCVWAIGRARVRTPASSLVALQQASGLLLARPGSMHAVLSPQGHVMLLLGMTRLCAAAACRLSGKAARTPLLLRHDARASTVSCGQGAHRRRRGHPLPRRWSERAGLQLSWLHALCCSLQPDLAKLPPSGVVGLLWSLGRLRCRPRHSFLMAALQRVETTLPQLSARHIAVLLWSLARLRHVPHEQLLAALVHAWELRTAEASSADRQQARWGQQQLAKLHAARVA